jgi:hypothetical protein
LTWLLDTLIYKTGTGKCAKAVKVDKTSNPYQTAIAQCTALYGNKLTIQMNKNVDKSKEGMHNIRRPALNRVTQNWAFEERSTEIREGAHVTYWNAC